MSRVSEGTRDDHTRVIDFYAPYPASRGQTASRGSAWVRGEDGDTLDMLVISPESTFPGCIIPGRVIGVLEAEQTEDEETIRNDRLVAVPEIPY